LYGIYPTKFAGIIGDHQNFPIECLQMSPKKDLIASAGHDALIKFWDARDLGRHSSRPGKEIQASFQKNVEEDLKQAEDEEGEEDEEMEEEKPRAVRPRPQKKKYGRKAFFSDLL
jgi:hypothetical protein